MGCHTWFYTDSKRTAQDATQIAIKELKKLKEF